MERDEIMDKLLEMGMYVASLTDDKFNQFIERLRKLHKEEHPDVEGTAYVENFIAFLTEVRVRLQAINTAKVG